MACLSGVLRIKCDNFDVSYISKPVNINRQTEFLNSSGESRSICHKSSNER